MTLVVFLAALIGGMLIGLPICFALLFSGVCMMLYLNGFNAQILSQNLFSGADSFSMMAVPFFIMAGEFMNRGGITKRIVNAAMRSLDMSAVDLVMSQLWQSYYLQV